MLTPKSVILLVPFFILGFALGNIIFDVPEKESVQYDFVIIIHDDNWGGGDTIYYSDDPPMYGSNCVMFTDAVTGLLMVEIAPRITARSTLPQPIEKKKKNKLKRYLICKR